MSSSGKTYVVEHLDPELEQWSALEYKAIAEESANAGSQFLLSSVPESLQLPKNLQGARGLNVERRSVETIFASSKDRVCLLDPAAKKELGPEDADVFDVFLFGGILGATDQKLPCTVYRLIQDRLGDDPPRGDELFDSAVITTLISSHRPDV